MAIRILLLVTVAVIMALASHGNPQSLIHRDECNETDHHRNAEEQILVAFYDYGFDFSLADFAEEDLGKEVEECVS